MSELSVEERACKL